LDGSWSTVTTHADGTTSIEKFSEGRFAEGEQRAAGGEVLFKKRYHYDSHGRVAAVDDLREGTTRTTYYADDQPDTVQHPHPQQAGQFLTTKHLYNSRGLLAERQLPDSSKTYYFYTPKGALERTEGSQTYPVSYGYDAQGRMISMTTWQDHTAQTGAAVTRWHYAPATGQLAAKEDGMRPKPDHLFKSARTV
jgi:YD repeat-containing protein